jgi:hypothetical protein
MIAYNTMSLNNLHIHQQTEVEFDAGTLTSAELQAIKQKYPVGFYSPSIFIRVGLFVLTFIIVLFSSVLFTLILSSSGILDSFGWPLFLGLATYAALEVTVQNNKHYHSGVDDALLYMATSLLIGSFAWIMARIDNNYSHSHYLSISIFTLILSGYFTLRFADALMSALTALSFLASVFFGWESLGAFGLTTLPFIMIAASAFLYFAASRLKVKSAVVYYINCLLVTQVVGLLVFYLAGNYYVVKELGNQINHLPPGTPLPFGAFFWLWTMLIPFAYIARGIKNKDALLLRTGLLLIAGAIFTFRNYYHVMQIEMALTLGGIILTAVAYAIIRYLKTHRYGFTSEAANRKDITDHLKIESLIVAETFGHAPAAPDVPVSPFGGGDAGGGGSSGGF